MSNSNAIKCVYTLCSSIPIFAHFYDALQLVLSNEKCLITHTQFVHRPFAAAALEVLFTSVMNFKRVDYKSCFPISVDTQERIVNLVSPKKCCVTKNIF